jgi:hypothetical protein
VYRVSGKEATYLPSFFLFLSLATNEALEMCHTN